MATPDIQALNVDESNALAALLETGTVIQAAKALDMSAAQLRKVIDRSPNLRECWQHYASMVVANACTALACEAENVAEKIISHVREGTPIPQQTLKLFELVLERAESFMNHRELRREIEALRRMLDESGESETGTRKAS